MDVEVIKSTTDLAISTTDANASSKTEIPIKYLFFIVTWLTFFFSRPSCQPEVN